MCFNWYTSIHHLNAYQIKFCNQLEKRKTCVYTLCMHLVQVIILQGIVLFQSLKFYDDEISCKQANLLVTYLLMLSLTVVNACVYYISWYILSYFCSSGCLELEAVWIILSI